MIEPLVSIIIPVRNEAGLLKNCLESISNLDYPKDRIEVIIADGMSTDDTVNTAKQLGARVVLNEKKTVSPGRNIAFKLAKGEIIAFTDADCIVDKDWIINSLKYFKDDEVACAGGPNLTPPDEGNFGKAVGFVFNQGIFSAGSIHARELKEVKEVRSIPGCNAVYRKNALDKVMPIDETLLTCDDTELNQRLLDKGFKLLYTPDVFVWHHRRPNPKKLFKQMYRYAIGRLQVGKKDRRMLNLVHIMVGLALPAALAVLIFSSMLFMLLLAGYLLLVLIFSIRALQKTGSVQVSLLVPVVISIILLGWSMGFMRELIFPLRGGDGK
ncbi:MAG: glycosyltransferase family 2 protein [Nitrospirae bacterium]|nr:MAG: glycosyltransferase family 2 protein [Nitrospirota bacterium]